MHVYASKQIVLIMPKNLYVYIHVCICMCMQVKIRLGHVRESLRVYVCVYMRIYASRHWSGTGPKIYACFLGNVSMHICMYACMPLLFDFIGVV